MRLIRALINWVKKNPTIAISLTATVALLIYKNRTYIEYQIKKAFSNVNNPTFLNPLKVKGRISTLFNIKDKLHAKPHSGVDIAVAYVNVYAPADGTAYDISNKDGGIQLQIKHTNGYKTGYAHLSKLLVKTGQPVKAGDLVAITGNSGAQTTGAHLHFTMRDPQNNLIDPLKHFNFA